MAFISTGMKIEHCNAMVQATIKIKWPISFITPFCFHRKKARDGGSIGHEKSLFAISLFTQFMTYIVQSKENYSDKEDVHNHESN